MKKTSTIVKEKSTFDISILINNTAYIQSVTGKTGLLNIRTNQIIGDMDKYYTIYDTSGKFYYQTKEAMVASDKKNLVKGTVIRIYDALNEHMIADGWEVVTSFEQYYHVAVLRSPITGKVHLYDNSICRKPTNIFDMELDDVEELYEYYSEKYYVVTVNGKKGLYQKGQGLQTAIEFDNIEKLPSVVVYTKGKYKYFVCTGKEGKQSGLFETITVDKNNNNVLYCKKGNTTYVYNTYTQELLLETDSDKIQYIKKTGDSYDNCKGEFFFLIKDEGKYGLMSSIITNEIRKSPNPEARVTTLLQTVYDEIAYDYGTFYIEKDGKQGIFLGDSYHSQTVSPIYDKVVYLGDNFYAFYKGDYCDIGKVMAHIPYEAKITNCQIEANLNQGLIYKKENKKGLLLTNCKSRDKLIPAEHDDINCFGDFYFMLEKDGKKGVMHLGKMIIPQEYDEITYGGFHSKYNSIKDAEIIYFALKKGDKYELAKRHNYQYVDSEVQFVENHVFDKIEFFRDIMVFTDSQCVYIYDYSEKLLKTLPANTVITPVEKAADDYDRKRNYIDYVYSIDGVCYYYKEGKFEEVFAEDNDYYVTTYETDTDSFVVRTLSKEEHDAFCNFIDEKEDEEAENSLVEMSSNNNTLRKDYPTLTLRKIPKNEAPKED